MLIDIGNPSESATVKCEGMSVPLQFEHNFPGAWRDLHSEEHKGGNQYEIKDWSVVLAGGSLLARKTYL